MVNSPEQAIRECEQQSAHGPRFRPYYCKREVREAYGITQSHSDDAAEAWAEAKHKHPTDDPMAAPRGALLFWTGGSEGYGHVAIAAGHGMMWSTDIKRLGYFDLAPITDVRRKWGTSLRFVGWTEDLDGVRVLPVPKRRYPLVEAVMHAKPGHARTAAMKVLAEKGSPRAAQLARVWLRGNTDKHRALTTLRAMLKAAK